MHLPIAPYRPPPAPELPAHVRPSVYEDVQWSRPVFKAPPLEKFLEGFDTAAFAQELPRGDLIQR
jgi:hypothetical protein